MPSPILAMALARLRRDLERESINKDLLNEFDADSSWLRALDQGDDKDRALFCCHVVLSRLASELLREADKPLEYFKNPPKNPIGVLVESGLGILRPLAEHYGIEVAEYQMTEDARDAKQLAHDFNLQSQKKVELAFVILTSARDGKAETLGSAFYAFMYRELQDIELLSKWMRALAEVQYGNQA